MKKSMLRLFFMSILLLLASCIGRKVSYAVEDNLQQKGTNTMLNIYSTDKRLERLNSNYGYRSLSITEKTLYNNLCQLATNFSNSKNDAIKNGEEQYITSYIDISALGIHSNKVDVIDRVMFAIEADKPFFFWIDKYYCASNTGSSIVNKIALRVYKDYALFKDRDADMQIVLNNIGSYLDDIDQWKAEGKSEIQLELLIHDRIITDVRRTGDCERSFCNIIGFFKHKIVRTQGFAITAQMFFTYAGIESIYVVGINDFYELTEEEKDSYPGDGVNYVCLDGLWYSVNLLADSWEDDKLNKLYYGSFNLTAEQSSDFISDYLPYIYKLPNLTNDPKYNYYTYFNLDFRGADCRDDSTYIELLYKAIVSSKERGDYLLRIRVDEEMRNITGRIYASYQKSLFDMLNDKLAKHNIYARRVYHADKSGAFIIRTFNDYVFVSLDYYYMDGIENGMTYFSEPDIMVHYMKNRIHKIDDNVIINSSGSGVDRTYTVIKDSITIGNYDVKVTPASVSLPQSFTYSAGGVTPTPVVSIGDTKLTMGIDYTVSYQQNKGVTSPNSKAKLIITGIGKYRGTITKEFDIMPKDVNELKITLSSQSVTYNGTSQKPTIKVYNGITLLKENMHYRVSYSNHCNVGTAKVTVTGLHPYIGTKTLTFNITPISLLTANIRTVKSKYEYKGGDLIKPGVYVMIGKLKLKNGTDYRVTYKNNISIGTGTVTITGIGTYTGSRTLTFQIIKKDIANCTIQPIASQGYIGKKLTPKIQIKNGKHTLKLGKDYTVKYSSNVKLGRAKVVITGKGTKYTDKKTIYFNIIPKKTPQVTLTSKKKEVSVKWKKISGATGYQVYYSTKIKGTYKKWVDTRSTSYKKSKLTKGKVYYVKVRQYVKVSGKKVLGNFSKVKKITVK